MQITFKPSVCGQYIIQESSEGARVLNIETAKICRDDWHAIILSLPVGITRDVAKGVHADLHRAILDAYEIRGDGKA